MDRSQDPQKLILVVDDEPDIIAFLTTLIEDNGFEAVAARDGAEAMDRVKARRPDLITLDITMPEKSGVRFYRELKTDPDLKQIPVVIVTGVTGGFDKFISTRKQVPPPEGFIAKPIEKDKFIQTLQGLISP